MIATEIIVDFYNFPQFPTPMLPDEWSAPSRRPFETDPATAVGGAGGRDPFEFAKGPDVGASAKRWRYFTFGRYFNLSALRIVRKGFFAQK